jgi:hypothetical protein
MGNELITTGGGHMRRGIGILAAVVLLTAATTTPFGGWAVVTVLDMPTHLEVGQATTIAFQVRQHGKTLLEDLDPTLSLRHSDAGFIARMFKRDRVDATFRPEAGVYEARITPTDTGEVTITIDTDFRDAEVELLPIHVVASGAGIDPLAPDERGRQLFAAKGCATCHAKDDDAAFAEWMVVRAGPDLTNRTFPREWLEQKLADPAVFRSAAYNGNVMPNLRLSAPEIDALASYLGRGDVTAQGIDRH